MSQLSLDDVVALNALIVTAIGLSFALGRKERKPPGLNLTGPRRSTALDEIPTVANAVEKRSPSNAIMKASYAARSSGYGATALQRLEDEEMQTSQAEGPHESRQLNVFFNWNGHTWEAYEVLGLPAGASRDSVVQAFHAGRAKSPDSIAFLQAATDAILKR